MYPPKGLELSLATQLAHFPWYGPGEWLCWKLLQSRCLPPIPRLWLLDSIQGNLTDAAKHMEDQPVYYVLNFCRALAYPEAGGLLSKQEGGEVGAAPSAFRNIPVVGGSHFGGLCRRHFCGYPAISCPPVYCRNVEPLEAGKSRSSDRKWFRRSGKCDNVKRAPLYCQKGNTEALCTFY